MNAYKPVLNVRLSGDECDALRAIAREQAARRNEPFSLAAAVRGIVKQYIRATGGVAGILAGEKHGERGQ